MIRMMGRLASSDRPLPVRWWTVAALALGFAFANGFWLTVTQGAVGAIERVESPFVRWLRDSTLLLPLVGTAVLVALLWARARLARVRSEIARLAATVLLVGLIGTAVGMVALRANSAYDYSLQRQHLELLHSYGVNPPSLPDLAGFRSADQLSYYLYCNLRGAASGNPVALLEYATLMVHVRALAYAGALILASNLAIATVVLALRNDET